MSGSARILVLGFGNELRRDDAVGPMVARALAARGLPHVSAHALPQLTPELAAELAQYDQAIFVDASVALGEDGAVELLPVEPQPGAMLGAHAGTPGSLLALAEALYAHTARCWLIAIPVANVELGEGLTDLARRNGEIALSLIREHCQAQGASHA